METRFYQASGLEIERIASELERMFLMQGYQVQHFGDQGHTVVQFKKGGDFAAVVGMQAALTLTLQRSPGGVMAVIGQQKWADKAAVGVVGMLVLWPLAFTAGAGAIRQSNLTGQLLSALDAVVRQQSANVQIGPVPLQMLPPQVQQQVAPAYAPPVAPPPVQAPPLGVVQKPCPHCAALNDAHDIYCSRCGKSLAVAPGRSCPQCGASVKPDAVFCTTCGHAFASPGQGAEPTVAADMTPRTEVMATPVVWGYLVLANGKQLELVSQRLTIGRAIPGSGDTEPDINLYESVPESTTISRMHAVIEAVPEGCMLTDLRSTNLTRVNGQTLTPNVPVFVAANSTCDFGKVRSTFKRV